MRDPELMISLLQEMAKDAYGRVHIGRPTYGASEEDQHRTHQAELLVDAGLADGEIDSRGVVRITNYGHDFLAAIQQSEDNKQKFLNWAAVGALADAASKVIELAKKLMGDS